MLLSERIKTILDENNLKQNAFAESIYVTGSYISKLLRGESGLASSTATLIEKKYGYTANWILTGEEPKMSTNRLPSDITPLQRQIISSVESMNDAELSALKAFIESLKVYKSHVEAVKN
jgi:transcriptional regulator with XRE-family HTH domain